MLWITDLKGASNNEGNDTEKIKGRLICSAFVMCVGMILGYTCENSLWVNGTFAVTYVVAMAVTFTTTETGSRVTRS